MTGYTGNFWQFWDNGRQFTSSSESLDGARIGYADNKVLAANIGIEQSLPGVFDPAVGLTGFLDTTNTADYLHKYWGDTYNNETGVADDIDHVIACVVGYDAAPVQGNPVFAWVMAMTGYDPQTATDGAGKFKADFAPRGVHSAICDAVLIGNAATVTTSTTSSAYNRGSAYATGQTAGGFAMLQWSGSGSSDVTALIQTSTTSGGTYATAATLTLTGVTKGAAYVVIPAGTTINEYVKVTWTLSSSPQTADYCVALGFFNA